jgi:type III pantothenate kinase
MAGKSLMLLCDIGNSSFAFYEDGKVTSYLIDTFDINSVTQEVYYICVNPKVSKLLEAHELWHDLAPMIHLEGSYDTLGIDRQVAVLGLEGDGVIVDAGSAITVDVVEQGSYQGGFIYPGFLAMQQAFAQISSKLDYLLNFEVTLDKIATNSQDAISYGAIAPIIAEIRRISEDKTLIVTGGDGKIIAKHLKGAQLQPNWLFDAMTKIINARKG